MLTSLFLSLGWTRDSAHWVWIQVLTAAGLIASDALDLPYWLTYIGVSVSTTTLHRIDVVAILLLWLAGKYDSSSLPGAKKP